MPHTTQQMRMVVVGNDERNSVMKVLLSEENPAACQLYHAQHAAELLSLSSGQAFDLIVLDVPARNSMDISAIGRIREGYPAIPVVVLNSNDPEELRMSALRHGLHEALLNISGHDTDVAATENSRVATLATQIEKPAAPQIGFERVLRILEQNQMPLKTAFLPETVGLKPLRETMPYKFLELAKSYGNVLDLATSRSADKRGAFSGHSVSQKLQFLASDLGGLKAGVRDVLDLHTQAVEATSSNRLQKEQTRKVLFELVTDLVSYYRQAMNTHA